MLLSLVEIATQVRIKVGKLPDGTIFVKDSGVGFNKQYIVKSRRERFKDLLRVGGR